MAALVALAAGGFAFSAAGDEIQFGKVKITYSNTVETPTRPEGESGPIVFTFKTGTGSLQLPGFFTCDVLVVGGGGAGGSGAAMGSTLKERKGKGAGGGGGGGGVIESLGLKLDGAFGAFDIVVGKGGARAESNDEVKTGENGQDSSFSGPTGCGLSEDLVAKGGGGGGAEGPGNDGGCGGGGSVAKNSGGVNGGAGTDGQGYDGGVGVAEEFGGGGGGAGGPGMPAAMETATGGVGRVSSIYDGTPRYYGGGGGGGIRSATTKMNLGGLGGGGYGGSGALADPDSVDGTDGLGGGGGGNCNSHVGGKGGDGVVIMRILNALDGPPEKPVRRDFDYNGAQRTEVAESPAYTIVEGTPAATDAGTYHVKVKLNEGFEWSDHTTDDVEFDWQINPQTVEKPVKPAADFTYDGKNHNALESVDPRWLFIGLGEGNNQTNGVNAGSYYYKVSPLNGNYAWVGGGSDPVRIDWKILPREAVVPEYYTNLVYNAKFQEVLDREAMDKEAYHIVDGTDYGGTDAADDYVIVLTLNSGNFIWNVDGKQTTENQLHQWAIAVATNAITSLKVDSWKVGSPIPSRPRITALWGLGAGDPKPTYQWAAETEGAPEWHDWVTDDDAPTEAGNYRVRAEILAGKNWEGAVAEASFMLWTTPTDLFTDFVPITVKNSSGSAWNDYKLKITLREDDPAGFSYSRAGLLGDALVFINAAGTLQLPYEVETWNPNGESTLYVYLDALPVGGTTVSLYWHLKPDKTPPPQPPLPTSPTSGKSVTSEFGLVSRDGLLIDRWVLAPTITPDKWDEETPPDQLTTNASALASGAKVRTGFYNVYDPSVTNAFEEAVSATNGTYIMFFAAPERPNFAPLSFEVIFRVVGHSPDIALGGSESGRILLMNNDFTHSGTRTSPQVRYQGWYCSDDSNPYGAKKSTTATFWQKVDDETEPSWWQPYRSSIGNITWHDTTYNRKPGTEWILWTKNYGHRLWHLVNCRQGNTYKNAVGVTNPDYKLADMQNYLPWSSNSFRMTVEDTAKGYMMDNTNPTNQQYTGQILMQNTTNACIYSSCFTNGVGTVYFDAVNGWRNRLTDYPESYQIVVEVATETKDGTPLTEETSHVTIDSAGQPITNLYSNIKEWKPVTLHPVHYKDGALTPEAATPKFTFAIKTGTTNQDFYRFYVPINHRPTPERPGVRFRIRRAGYDPEIYGKADADAYLLVDNIVVSYPPMTADLTSAGWFDETKQGKQLLGWESATTVPFPAAGESGVYGRAKGVYYTNAGDPSADPTRFIVAAKMLYRWRYLNQSDTSAASWRSVMLKPSGGEFLAMEPFALPAQVGDVEYRFETTFQAPYYEFKDYSGCGVSAKAFQKATGYTEEVTESSDRWEPQTRRASTGTDWFFRLRQGVTDHRYEKIDLVFGDGPMASTNAMELVEDNTWRALVPIPRDEKEDQASFTFRAYRLGETVLSNVVAETWGDATGGYVCDMIPANGIAKAGGAPIVFTVDHRANYYEIKLNEEFGTWSVTRCEYQNFNHWNDAHGSLFSANWAETNGVDDVLMQTFPLDMSGWDPFDGENDAWSELMYLPNYRNPDYEWNVLFQSHVTPAKWDANNVSFVPKYAMSKNDWDEIERTGEGDSKSGIAAKLRGLELGKIDFTKADKPNGLEKVTVSARIGQTISFDTLNFSGTAPYKSDYTFLTPVLMSNSLEGSEKFDNMAVGAAVSAFAYYRQSKGCYEFRLARDVSGPWLRAALYKWEPKNGVMTPRLLQENWFGSDTDSKKAVKLWTNGSSAASVYDRLKSYMMFISVKNNVSGGTEITACFSCASTGKPEDALVSPLVRDFGGKELAYNGLHYIDKTNPLTSGTYGVAAKDCPAVFTSPRHVDAPTAMTYDTKGVISAQKKMFTLGDLVDDHADLDADRWELNGSVGYKTEAECYQIYVPEQSQQIELWLQDKLGGDWEKIDEKTVSGYGFKEQEFTVRRTGEWNVRVKTGGANVDVAVGSIRQWQWQAPDLLNSSEKFAYTQAIVELRNGKKAITLQPARGLPTKPVSIRSPVVDGLGRISFSYDVATLDPAAEIWVQVATNHADNLTGASGYNLSILSVDVGEPEPVGTWLTVEKYTAAQLKEKGGTVSTYLGWHDQKPKRPVHGVFRLFVPVAVVERAQTAAADYGKLTITAMTVTDEPGLSDRAWRGWNMRTIGDLTDSEKRMYLFDSTLGGETGYGLVCGLNNSINDVEKDDQQKASTGFPAIYSPTLNVPDESSSIGSAVIKARLYESVAQTSKGGKIVVWGSNDSTGTKWENAGTIVVDSPVFRDYTWSGGGHSFRALKFEVYDMSAKTTKPAYDRVVIDEIVIGERVEPTVGFEYARPFRMDLMKLNPIADIFSMNEQPLAGENWGVQTKLTLKQMSDEIDVERGFDVRLSYFVGKTPWGYGRWANNSAAVRDLKMVPAGDPTNLIFRSYGETADSLVRPIDAGGTFVQYQVTVTFWSRGDKPRKYTRKIEVGDGWRQPEWFYPIDPNKDAGASGDNPDAFSPYTVLDTISPGRAWINEVNWNDGDPSENNNDIIVTNQFIELCVPSGADMDGWYVRLTDYNLEQCVLAYFGQTSLPSKPPVTEHAVENFEFVVIESPDTQMAGGIRDEDGKEVALGTWSQTAIDGTATGGTLSYNRPFQFELVRPSGIVEHQFVVAGTNTMAHRSYGYIWDATNLLAKLQADASPKRFLAGDEQSRCADGRHFGSIGVTGGKATADPGPGGEGTWTERLEFTPGRINVGQVIPEGWHVVPNGTNTWVTFTVLGDKLRQDVGGDMSSVVRVVLPQGVRTNVTYTAPSWYELAALTVNGATVAVHQATGGNPWTYTLHPTGVTCNVVASQGYDAELDARFHLGDNPFAPSVIDWLVDRYPHATVDDIRLANYLELDAAPETASKLNLIEMYWLDIPPVNVEDREGDESEWWLRAGLSGIQTSVPRVRPYMGGEIILNDIILDMTLYVSNATTTKAYAPYRLQGLNYKRSDMPYAGLWGSETFQIRGSPVLVSHDQYAPLRYFVFNGSSFSGPDDEKPFTARIELLDPYSPASPGYYYYNWSDYDRSKAYFDWALGTNSTPYSVEMLKANDTYGD